MIELNKVEEGYEILEAGEVLGGVEIDHNEFHPSRAYINLDLDDWY